MLRLTALAAAACLFAMPAALAQSPPKMTFAYSLSGALASESIIVSPYGLQAVALTDNVTISGPWVNGTGTSAGVAYAAVAGNGTVENFNEVFPGMTSDGVPFQIRENGVIVNGTTNTRQEWIIGGAYSFLTEQFILCNGITNDDSIKLDCFCVQ